MEKFKHHSAFQTEKQVQSYLFPNVCFHCRKSYKKPKSNEPRLCPECGKEMTQLSRKFSAPSKSPIEEWNVVEFLVSEGFRYFTIHLGDGKLAKYPRTMKEAAEFVRTYKKLILNEVQQRSKMSNRDYDPYGRLGGANPCPS